jgi:hypothetical protein
VDKKQRLASASYYRRQICLAPEQEKAHDQQLSIQTIVKNQCFVPLDTASKGEGLWEQTNRVSRFLDVLVGSTQPSAEISG